MVQASYVFISCVFACDVECQPSGKDSAPADEAGAATAAAMALKAELVFKRSESKWTDVSYVAQKL